MKNSAASYDLPHRNRDLEYYDNAKTNRSFRLGTILFKNNRMLKLVLAVILFGVLYVGFLLVKTTEMSPVLAAGLSIKRIPLISNRNAERYPSFLDGVTKNEAGVYQLDYLIMVAGHAITVAESLEQVSEDDNSWFLLPYQYNQGIPLALVSHIQAGVRIASSEPRSLLIFSGGQTRGPAGPKSEGSSYYYVAEHFHWWGHTEVRARAVTEEYALDSFLNLLYSICRFREIVGVYPSKIAVVSYNFKEKRFSEVHRAALRFPAEKFKFIGLQPASPRFDLQSATDGELNNALEPYLADPYGCHTVTLKAKRNERDPFRRTPSYEITCPELAKLLQWCGPSIYPGNLPWLSLNISLNSSASFFKQVQNNSTIQGKRHHIRSKRDRLSQTKQ